MLGAVSEGDCPALVPQVSGVPTETERLRGPRKDGVCGPRGQPRNFPSSAGDRLAARGHPGAVPGGPQPCSSKGPLSAQVPGVCGGDPRRLAGMHGFPRCSSSSSSGGSPKSCDGRELRAALAAAGEPAASPGAVSPKCARPRGAGWGAPQLWGARRPGSPGRAHLGLLRFQ